jgi:putative heme iron utilization protein
MEQESSLTALEKAQIAYNQFPDSFQSLILSTVSEDGFPHISYAPFVMDETKNIYILASDLASHTQHLRSSHKASVLFIAEESQTQQIFARTRLTFDCTVKMIERETTEWKLSIEQMQDRFGEIVGMLRGLMDFHLFQLTPTQGQFVMGFGQAYQISGEQLDVLTHQKRS